METRILKALAISLIISFSQNVFAESGQTRYKTDSWLMKMIYQPSQSILNREAHGLVNIYDGFTDKQIDEILDHKFERIAHMMFTRVKKTDTAGAVLKNPRTGEDVIEDDGCD